MKRGTGRPAGRDFERLSTYLKSLRGLSPNSREEEHRLAVRARAGDVVARQRLVQGALAFVVSIAGRQSLGTLALEDVIQEGNLGLMRAAEKFDPDAGTRFSTYAAWWIRAYIGKYLKEARSSVRPRSGEVAVSDLSLDVVVDEENDTTRLDRLEDERVSPEEAYLAVEAQSEVKSAIGGVRKRVGELGWQIIRDRLQGDQRLTLEAIGKVWGLSRERVRQVELQTKKILARRLEPADRSAA